MKEKREIYDMIIIGGGLAASFLSLSIFKRNPDFRILIIEKTEYFPQKIGESLLDIAALFVKSLDIDHILSRHTAKSGIRFLFNENKSSDLSQIAEFASPTFPGLIKGYHLDRKLFDQDILDEVDRKGAQIYRPAQILRFSHEDFKNELDLEVAGEFKKVQAKWLVDATGRHRYIPNELKWEDRKIGLNTGAIMAHFKNIAPTEIWDTPQNEYWDTASIGLRKFSTTHLMRKHCWWWIIRLDEERTSIGVVFDKHKVDFEDPQAFFLQQIQEDPQLSLMTEGAERGKIRHIEHLPYVSKHLYSKGIALLGESGAFLDPFVSPGIELIGQQCIFLSELLCQEKESNRFDAKAWKSYEGIFQHAYTSRLRIYEEAYQFMDSYELFTNWLMQGNFMYFVRVVYPAVIFPHRLRLPLRFNLMERVALNYFSQRFKKIYEQRKQQNRQLVYPPNSLKYSGVRLTRGPRFLLTPIILFAKILGGYLKLELKELNYLFKSDPGRVRFSLKSPP
ncbi:MAG: tryptophan 7-halogenase [Bacteroidia bacterium]|nr:tryptophan 7-halogenase [Bacteroidia bacterium]